jgi:hypothetical protein
MKRTLAALFLLGLLPVAAIAVRAVAAGPAKPDFSGTWIIDFAKSRLQIQAKIESGEFTIDHKDPDFRFDRVFTVEGKKDETSYALTTDGKVKVEELADRTLRSRLFWDGDVLVFDVRIVLKNGREATNVVRYSLREGGRTFVAEEKFRGPKLQYDNVWVAERKR